MTLSETEYAALRRTIAIRGTVRMAVVPLVVLGWGALFSTTGAPLGGLPTLLLLAAGFEAVHALHVGVERIGRYLQVFYEDQPGGPRWESTAMAVGPALPGGGTDPLFTLVFAGAVLLNLASLLPAARLASTPPLAGISVGLLTAASGLAHMAVLVRMARARQAAARQRAVELESFRALRTRGPNGS